jgi:MFS family permease
MYGRKPVFLMSMIMFTVLAIPAGIGSSLEEVIIARFFGALFAAACITNAPGTLGDITKSEDRPLTFSIWSIGPVNGPGMS